MKHWAFVDSENRILRVNHSVDQPPAQANEECVELLDWEGNPPEPAWASEFKVVGGRATWVDSRDFDQVKADKRAEINSAWLAANRGGFMFDGHRIGTDELDSINIEGTATCVLTTGDFPAGWTGAWKTAANAWVDIPDKAAWQDFIAARSAQGAANFATAQALKAQLDAAQTMAEVDAVAWPAPAP